MDLFGVDILLVLGGLVGAIVVTVILALAAAAMLTIAGGSAVVIFWKTRKIVVPKVTLFILNILEAPIKNFIMMFNIDESFLDYTVIEIQNMINRPYYASTEYANRMLFLPQCLRNPKCPAPLDEEGLQCKACGRCGIFKIKEYAEQLGYHVFIAPGSTLIKRMVKRYRPKAIMGVGCHMEVKEGVVSLASYGIPVQGVVLERDGCVNTRVDVLKLLEKINLNNKKEKSSYENIVKVAEGMSNLWDDSQPKEFEIKSSRTIYKR